MRKQSFFTVIVIAVGALLLGGVNTVNAQYPQPSVQLTQTAQAYQQYINTLQPLAKLVPMLANRCQELSFQQTGVNSPVQLWAALMQEWTINWRHYQQSLQQHSIGHSPQQLQSYRLFSTLNNQVLTFENDLKRWQFGLIDDEAMVVSQTELMATIAQAKQLIRGYQLANQNNN